MMSCVAFDLAWRDAVRDACEPVLLAAAAGFEWNESVTFDGGAPALLWEATPTLFAERYPDSEIEESYGDQWPQVGCIDFWIYLDVQAMSAQLSTEGWSGPDPRIAMTGDGPVDGHALAAAFAKILRVPFPVEP